MRHAFVPRLTSLIDKFIRLSSQAKKIRHEKFMSLTGSDWSTPPTIFCHEKTKIHPKLIGRFYGENNIKQCCVEIRRVDRHIAFRCAWRIRSCHTWTDKSQANSSNKYHSLVVDGPKIGTRKGLSFRRGSDGRYYLGNKQFMELVMKKL